jgi:hypothetical protein
MKTENGLDVSVDEREPNKVHLVVNKLWKEQSPAGTEAMIAAAMNQLHDGYRLMFPVIGSYGVIYGGVALVAEYDHRVRALGVKMDPAATHLALCLLFKGTAELKAQVKKIIRLWPEQPEFPNMVFSEQ